MQPAALITVIIPHCNGEAILRDCLRSLTENAGCGLDILLVDNASSDSSAAMVRAEFPQVRILSLDRNHGFAGGCNAGIRAVSTPYVLILNNDTIHAPQWVARLQECLESDARIAVVQPKLRSYYQPDVFDYSGACGGELDMFGFPFARGRLFEQLEKDNGQYDQVDPNLFWASGTAFLARREVLLTAGLFDEHFFAHMEEIDLQWRIQLMGYQIRIAPQAVVWHRSGYTLGAEAPLKKYLNHRNAWLMFLANYRLMLTLYLFPIRLLLESLAFFFSLLRRDWGRAGAILRALGWLLIHPLMIVRKRHQVKSIRRLGDRDLLRKMYRGSIALRYYLGGLKTYGKLLHRRSAVTR